mgnify:FL=1
MWHWWSELEGIWKWLYLVSFEIQQNLLREAHFHGSRSSSNGVSWRTTNEGRGCLRWEDGKEKLLWPCKARTHFLSALKYFNSIFAAALTYTHYTIPIPKVHWIQFCSARKCLMRCAGPFRMGIPPHALLWMRNWIGWYARSVSNKRKHWCKLFLKNWKLSYFPTGTKGKMIRQLRRQVYLEYSLHYVLNGSSITEETFFARIPHLHFP